MANMETTEEKEQPSTTGPDSEPEHDPKHETAETGQQQQGNGNDDRESASLSREKTKDVPAKSVMELTILFGAVFFSIFLMAMTGSIIATAIPQITTHFKSLEDIGWYGSASLVTTCCLQPFVGKLYTHFPTKYIYIVFMVIFTVGSIVCGVASSSNMLIGGRAIQGAGGAGMVNGAFTVIATLAPPDKKPMFTGVGMALATVGQVIGPTIGGALTDKVSWRWCFYINLPFSGVVLLVLSTLSIPEQTEKKPFRSTWLTTVKEELDLVGFALFAPAAVMLLLAIIWGGNKFAWNSATIIGLFCGSVATTVVFALWQVHLGEKAMIPPRIIRKQLVVFGCATNFFQMASNLTLSYYLPLWFQVVKGATPLMSGVMILPTAISQSIGAVLAGKFVQVMRYCAPWAMFGSMISTIGSGLMTTFVPSTGTGEWIGYQILVGLGRASVFQMPITAIQGFLPLKEQAMATSQVFFFQYLGGTVFLAAAETIFTSGLRSALPRDAPGVNPEMIIGAGATAVRSVVSKADLPGVLRAYNHAIVDTYYMSVAATAVAFFMCMGLGWKKLPEKAPTRKKDVESLGRIESNPVAA